MKKYLVMMVDDDDKEYVYGSYDNRDKANEIAMLVRDNRHIQTYVHTEEVDCKLNEWANRVEGILKDLNLLRTPAKNIEAVFPLVVEIKEGIEAIAEALNVKVVTEEVIKPSGESGTNLYFYYNNVKFYSFRNHKKPTYKGGFHCE